LSWGAKVFDYEEEAIEGVLEKSEKMIDLGVGDGNRAARLAKICQANEVYGVDMDCTRLWHAQKKGIIGVRADLNRPFPFRSGTFNLVNSNQVIEHLIDPDTFAMEIRRILKVGVSP